MIVEQAPAKINLALHVRHRRPDGYHELETIFAFARDGDVVAVQEAAEDSFEIKGPYAAALKSSPARSIGLTMPRMVKDRPGDDPTRCWGPAKLVEGQPQGPNLVEQARSAFRLNHTLPPVAITLTKNLPVASGIGGGSADAAATLRALARLTGTIADLHALAAQLGADVPACLHGRTSLGTARGDDLMPIEGLPGTPLLLVNPGVAISTAAAFAAWDGHDRGQLPEGDLLARARAARNDLEPAATRLAPVIAEVRALLDQAPGVLLHRMSGSGATCFALFEDEGARARAATQARARGWWCLETAFR